MSERAVHPAQASAATAPADATAITPYAEFWLKVGERFGVPTVLLILAVWWIKADIVQPLLDAHFSVVGKIVDAQERHSEQLGAIGEKLDTLIRVSQDAPPKKSSASE